MDIILLALKNYGIFGFIFLSICFILFKYIKSHIPIWLERKKNNTTIDEPVNIKVEDESIDLKSHQIFTNMQYMITVDIPHLSLLEDKPNRELMFKQLITIYIKTVDSICMDIINENMTTWDSNQWSNELTSKIAKMVTDTEKTAIMDGIPVEVVKIFSSWNMNIIDSLRESISTLSKSKLYSDPISRTYTFLLMIDLLLITTLGDIQRYIAELNGEISGLSYKNLIIE